MITESRVPAAIVKTPADIEWSKTRWPRWLCVLVQFIANRVCWATVIAVILGITALLHGA